jgi:hypothetical protein
MSNEVTIAIVGGIVSIILGIISIITLRMTLRANIKQIEIQKSQAALEQSQANLHKQINSRMDELLRLTKEKGNAEGRAEQKEENKRLDS